MVPPAWFFIPLLARAATETCDPSCAHGECRYHSDSESYACDCPSVSDDATGTVVRGYMGPRCETQFTTCDDANGRFWRCYNGSVCGYDVSCTCGKDYSGRFCETSAVTARAENAAASPDGETCPLPCRNEGTCAYHGAESQYYCKCPVFEDAAGRLSHGFQGVACQTPFASCVDENRKHFRCYNGATCGYDVTCNCASEAFSGQFCEVGGEDVAVMKTAGWDPWTIIGICTAIVVPFSLVFSAYFWRRALKRKAQNFDGDSDQPAIQVKRNAFWRRNKKAPKNVDEADDQKEYHNLFPWLTLKRKDPKDDEDTDNEGNNGMDDLAPMSIPLDDVSTAELI